MTHTALHIADAVLNLLTLGCMVMIVRSQRRELQGVTKRTNHLRRVFRRDQTRGGPSSHE